MSTETSRWSPLRRLRFNAGMTQAELAEAAGVAQATISDIEHGRYVGRPATLKSVADVLKCEVVDFLSDEGAA